MEQVDDGNKYWPRLYIAVGDTCIVFALLLLFMASKRFDGANLNTPTYILSLVSVAMYNGPVLFQQSSPTFENTVGKVEATIAELIESNSGPSAFITRFARLMTVDRHVYLTVITMALMASHAYLVFRGVRGMFSQKYTPCSGWPLTKVVGALSMLLIGGAVGCARFYPGFVEYYCQWVGSAMNAAALAPQLASLRKTHPDKVVLYAVIIKGVRSAASVVLACLHWGVAEGYWATSEAIAVLLTLGALAYTPAAATRGAPTPTSTGGAAASGGGDPGSSSEPESEANQAVSVAEPRRETWALALACVLYAGVYLVTPLGLGWPQGVFGASAMQILVPTSLLQVAMLAMLVFVSGGPGLIICVLLFNLLQKSHQTDGR